MWGNLLFGVELENINLLFSLIAMVLSLASVILVIIRIGIGLGIEFVERKEIREMKRKIDISLKNEWNSEWQLVVKRAYEKKRKEGEGYAAVKIYQLGLATRDSQIASILLKVLSKMIFDVVKIVVALIGIAILFVLSIWGTSVIPEFGTSWWILLSLEIILLLMLVSYTRRMIKTYLDLRLKFYELSENPILSKAKEIFNELIEKRLLYA